MSSDNGAPWPRIPDPRCTYCQRGLHRFCEPIPWCECSHRDCLRLPR